MKLVIVPNELRAEIYERIDKAIEMSPMAYVDREHFYAELLAFFDEHGYIPEFTVEPKQ